MKLEIRKIENLYSYFYQANTSVRTNKNETNPFVFHIGYEIFKF